MNEVVQWSDTLRICLPDIDGQHKGMVDVIGELYSAVTARSESQRIAQILNELERHTRFHFSTEEAMMRLEGYRKLHAHRAEHASFSHRLSMAQASLAAGEFPGLDLLRQLTESLVAHIEGGDRDYARFIIRRQRPKSFLARLVGKLLP